MSQKPSGESQISIREVQEAALSVFPRIRDEVTSLFRRHAQEPTNVDQTLWMLFKYQSERSQAVSFLMSHGYAWDSEIILRSFYETSAKILFICFAPESEKATLVSEFWGTLGDINNRKAARKAHFNESFARSRNDSFDEAVFAAFQNEEIFSKSRLTKSERKRLEQKWSFSEIINSLSKDALKEIIVIFHMYGLASHLAHADSDALRLMIDRQTREDTERKLLECAHACRIMSDQVSFSFFCAETLRRHFNSHFEDGTLFSQFNDFTDFAAKRTVAFEESQKAFYQSHGAKL